MPNTACEGGTATKLFSMISNYCPRVNLATVQRKYFNESKGVVVWRRCAIIYILLFLLGVQMVHQLVVPEYNSVELEVVSKLVLFNCRGFVTLYLMFIFICVCIVCRYYCLAAASV